jgi:outer membrane protein assembly factor BamB
VELHFAPIGDAHGFLAFPDSQTLLVHGSVFEPGRHRRVWLRVEAATGRTIWATDSLLHESPTQFDFSAMLASRGNINGNQPMMMLPDSLVALFASAEGLVCFETPTGLVRWRTPVNGQIGPIGQGYAPILVQGDTAYLPAGNS